MPEIDIKNVTRPLIPPRASVAFFPGFLLRAAMMVFLFERDGQQGIEKI
jgi:hypothetical protein